MLDQPVTVNFSQGTLLIKAEPEQLIPVAQMVKFDERVNMFRARACDYAPLLRAMKKAGIPIADQAREYAPIQVQIHHGFPPREHQQQALNAWREENCRGVVSMPTGSGKSYLAVMAIELLQRPTIVIVPTIDLLQQWASVLEKFFQVEIGMLGGGSREVRDITVSTYDSAVLRMEFIGNKFGLVVFDECHHLPGPVNRQSAAMCLAPFRLGLSATPEREDGEDDVLWDMIGPLAEEIHIDELEGHILAPYQTRQFKLPLDPDEEERYQASRALYTGFLKSNGISFRQRSDWQKFLGLCAMRPGGRKVFEAYQEQRRIARRGRAKLRKIWELLQHHRGARIIIFTAENDTAYEIGRQFLLPVITHRTKAAERKTMLDKFRSGEWSVLVTSRVLNEGVDVPEANVGIVVSGSAGTREHVQRLGRILRAVGGKQAVLYELISAGTSEVYVSQRRREHRAYRKR
jgi:superfamily II DNA or RNA helicase